MDPAGKAWIIRSSIDPFSPKNQPLSADTVRAIVVKLGVLDGAAPPAPATFVRRDGDVDMVTRPAVVIGEGRPGPGDPVLVQVSRWDRLKDMAGVMRLRRSCRAWRGGIPGAGRHVPANGQPGRGRKALDTGSRAQVAIKGPFQDRKRLLTC